MLGCCGISEFKWQNLSSARERFAALKLFDVVYEEVLKRQLRVDALIWDTEDSRHRVKMRDDRANLGRMYHHLLVSILTRRWPNGLVWDLHPDENSALNWREIAAHLESKSVKVERAPTSPLFDIEALLWELKESLHSMVFGPLTPRASRSSRSLTCLPDWLHFHGRTMSTLKYGSPSQGTKPQLCFEPALDIVLTKSQRERCLFLNHVDRRCKERRLGVGLKTTRVAFILMTLQIQLISGFSSHRARMTSTHPGTHGKWKVNEGPMKQHDTVPAVSFA